MFDRKSLAKVIIPVMCSMVALTALSVDALCASQNVLPSAGIDFALTDEGTSIKTIKDTKDSQKKKAKSGKTKSGTKDKKKEEKKEKEEVVPSSPVTSASVISAGILADIDEEIEKEVKSDTSETSDSNEKLSEDSKSNDESDTDADAIASMVPSFEELNEEESEEEEEVVVEETIEATTDKTTKETEREIDARKEEEGFKNLVIAQCDGWVNVRKEPNQDAEKVGKLYDKSAGEFIEEVDGWYKISSGSCTGYVKGEYCVTGDAAVDLAKQVGTRVCTVDTTTLYVRADATTDSACLGMVPLGEVLTVSEELDGWAKVNIEEGDGFVSLDYVKLSTEFVKAESKEEEEARLAKERKEREEAIAAAERANRNNNNGGGSGGYNYTGPVAVGAGGSELGRQVAQYALQFNGNPYVYGGSDPVHGADCSGFVMAIYKHFGVSLPHSANADRKVGYAVENVMDAAPGDLICYSGHVGLCIGDGKIIHASTTKTGIKISKIGYRDVLAVRRIF